MRKPVKYKYVMGFHCTDWKMDRNFFENGLEYDTKYFEIIFNISLPESDGHYFLL